MYFLPQKNFDTSQIIHLNAIFEFGKKYYILITCKYISLYWKEKLIIDCFVLIKKYRSLWNNLELLFKPDVSREILPLSLEIFWLNLKKTKEKKSCFR